MSAAELRTEESSMDGHTFNGAVGAARTRTGVSWTPWSRGMVIRAGATALSFGAAAIHAAVIGDHFREFWLYGVFFVMIAAMQVLWGVLVVVRPTHRTLAVGAVGSGAIALVWLLSRTAGIPVGPNGGGREAVGLPDTAATVFELVILVAIVVLARTRVGDRALSRTNTILSVAGVWLGVAVATVVAVLVAPADDEVELTRTGSGIGSFVRPHLIHVVLFLCAMVAVAVCSVIDRRRVRKASATPKDRSVASTEAR
jgi:hypothetical protein